MAFDGITISCITDQLHRELTGGRIYRIAQPEKDALVLTVRTGKKQHKLFLCASPSLPLAYLTPDSRPNPITAPNFCMLLRKHIQNGRITAITQPGLERVIRIDIQHLDELGDLCQKTLFIELMGKHSNLIFCDSSLMVIDSIKHISGMISSVREVLPGRTYFIPKTQEKSDPLTTSPKQFASLIPSRALPVFQSLYMSYTGLSPVISQEICYRAGIDADRPAQTLSAQELTRLSETFFVLMEQIKQRNFSCSVVYENNSPREYACIPLTMYPQEHTRHFSDVSEMLHTYYAQKEAVTRIRQKSSDLRRIVQTALERNIKKYDLQLKQIKDTEKREKYRIYGELLNTYGYSLQSGSKSMEALNHYTGEMVTIPLEETLSPSENARKYFEKYQKMKRTFEALTQLTAQVKAEIDHLESISASLDIALKEEDLVQIREELTQSGYIRRRDKAKKLSVTSRPFHYVSSDGYDIYVGKNNFQNDALTFHFAQGGDWWFHAKGIPGSHVILKAKKDAQIPDRAFEEAGKLAAYYSRGKSQPKTEIDYTLKKNVKKPGGAAPGFVVYYTNYSLVTDADISGLTLLSD